MIKVGLTGGIGSGKSLICSVFLNLGVPVYEADKEAKKLFYIDENIKANVIKLFGSSIYSNNYFQKDKLAAIVFNDRKALAKLNSIVHPEVFKNFDKWLNKNKNYKYIIKEAAILFESGADRLVDYSISVSAPMELRMQRVKKRDGVTEKKIKDRMNNQWSDDKRNQKADFVLTNDESDLLLPQILELHSFFERN